MLYCNLPRNHTPVQIIKALALNGSSLTKSMDNHEASIHLTGVPPISLSRIEHSGCESKSLRLGLRSRIELGIHVVLLVSVLQHYMVENSIPKFRAPPCP